MGARDLSLGRLVVSIRCVALPDFVSLHPGYVCYPSACAGGDIAGQGKRESAEIAHPASRVTGEPREPVDSPAPPGQAPYDVPEVLVGPFQPAQFRFPESKVKDFAAEAIYISVN